MEAILVLNAGSSSIKFAVFDAENGEIVSRPRVRGHIAIHEGRIELVASDADGHLLERRQLARGCPTFDADAAIRHLIDWLSLNLGALEISLIGHRVVHGGTLYTLPVMVTDAVVAQLETLIQLAPMHQGHNLNAIRIAREHWPRALHIACFDTAFHHTQAPVARALALPRTITSAGVQRYGFHGLSFEYIAQQLPRVLGPHATGKVIVAHLGNGASLCALSEGRSVASTMGFSVLDGLVMGSRCGTLDAGAVLYCFQCLGMTAAAVSDMLYSQSGLLGVSGISADMETLLSSKDPHAAEAIDLFVYRLAGQIGELAAALGGIEALIFTAGIGENSPNIRRRVCAACAWLGAALDDSANEVDLELIHAPTSALRIAVVASDEEAMIAQHAARLAATVLPGAPAGAGAVSTRSDNARPSP